MNAITTLMSITEAREITERIRRGATLLRDLLLQVYEREGWRALGYASMREYMLKEFPELSDGSLYRELQAGRTEKNVLPMGSTPINERVLRPIANNEYIEQPEAQREIWQDAVAKSNGRKPTARAVQTAKENYEQRAKIKGTDYITLEAWNAGERPIWPASSPSMNETNDNIEWAAWSWNPVTGCLHDCNYCYARDIANRFYQQGFHPSLVPGRILAPKFTKLPGPRWEGDFGYRGVFVCSMADLFGKWVPEEWITAVLDQARQSPQWTFLFLTKFPIRMAEFDYPQNAWLGTTVDKQWAVERAEKAFRKIKESGFTGTCWLSCEPMLERLTFTSLDMFDWVVMGGASKSTQTPEYLPPFDDIVHIYSQARTSGCKVYMKTNLLGNRIREYPY